MPLTRKFLSALGIEAEKVDEIINAHTEVTDSLKAERDGYKTDAEKLSAVQKELDDLKAANGKDSWKVKYDALKEDFDNYKNEQSAKETKAAKTRADKALLKKVGSSEKRIDAVLKVSDVDGIELDKDGEIKGADKLTASIKEEWADFIVSSSSKGADTPNPPSSNGSTLKTREEIYKRDDSGRFVMDSTERQKALSELLAAEQQKG